MAGAKLTKSWQQIAVDVAQERDSGKLNKLTDELLRAMKEETRQAYARLQVAKKPPEKAA